jgi:hypothetical protein
MAADDGGGAIDLLKQERTRQEMRPGDPAECNETICARAHHFGVPIRPTDQEGGRRDPAIAPTGEVGGKGFARDELAALVERDQLRPTRHGLEERLGLQAPPLLRTDAPTLHNLQEINGPQCDRPARLAGAIEIVAGKISFRSPSAAADGDAKDPQRPTSLGSWSADEPLTRAVRRPHLLEVVELPDLGPEDMDDHIAGVDQHPVAMGQALDIDACKPGLLQRFQEVVGNRTHVSMGAAGRDHHVVADRSLVLEVNGDGVLGFRVIKRFEDQLEYPLGRRRAVSRVSQRSVFLAPDESRIQGPSSPLLKSRPHRTRLQWAAPRLRGILLQFQDSLPQHS